MTNWMVDVPAFIVENFPYRPVFRDQLPIDQFGATEGLSDAEVIDVYDARIVQQHVLESLFVYKDELHIDLIGAVRSRRYRLNRTRLDNFHMKMISDKVGMDLTVFSIVERYFVDPRLW